MGRRPKGGIVPLFGKEGLGEISRKICLLNYGLLSKLQHDERSLRMKEIMIKNCGIIQKIL
jgi:hypothetical protein